MGELAIMNRSGDTKLAWDPGNTAETENARRTFDDLRKAGHLAYKMEANDARGEQLHTFDPNARRIVLAPAMRGG